MANNFFYISGDIPALPADSRRIRQVLINILNNAMKFTPVGGSITLKVCRCGDYVECSVSDTGKGIEAKFLPFVFDRFRQEKRLSTGADGLGLGLAIAREIITRHGGDVKAHSEGANRGASITFRLPINKRAS